MNRIITTLVFLVFPMLSQASEAGQRGATIARIEAAYTRISMLTPDSPFIATFYELAKASNPNLTIEKWNEFNGEVAEAVLKVVNGPGGVMDSMLQLSLAPMTDVELQRLENLFNDPAYIKFMAAMATPAAQKNAFQAMNRASLQMGGAINSVLLKHGYKEFH